MDMNTNPYPQGRWTETSTVTAAKQAGGREPVFISSPAPNPLKTPLRELFWSIPESRLLDEARHRIDSILAATLAPSSADVAQQQFALA
jgi:hypothetical protein